MNQYNYSLYKAVDLKKKALKNKDKILNKLIFVLLNQLYTAKTLYKWI